MKLRIVGIIKWKIAGIIKWKIVGIIKLKNLSLKQNLKLLLQEINYTCQLLTKN